MSRDEHDWTPEERRAAEALRRLPTVAADPRFRERLRRQFRTGQIPSRRAPFGWRWAAAAAVLLAVGAAAFFSQRGLGWTVIASQGSGAVRVDGRAIEVSDSGRLAAALVPGTLVETDERTQLRLTHGETLVLEITPESAVRLPAVPHRWLRRTTVAAVERGELRGVTGRNFTGARLRVELPDAVVEVTGTVFAVLRNADGSCVCVLEGTVQMHDAAGIADVPPLRRRLIPPYGEPPRDEPIRSMEQMKLEMLRDQARDLWIKAAEHPGDN